MKKIIAIGILGMFLLTNILSLSTLNLNATATSCNNFVSYSVEPLANSVERWAVIAGYGSEIYADEDAQDMRNVLVQYGWQDDNIKLLKQNDATRENIINGIRWMDSNEDENDITLFFFAGHGGYGKIFTYDQKITAYQLNKELNELESNSMTVIIDACYSGSMMPIFNLPGSTTLEVVENICGNNQYEIENYNSIIARNSQVNEETSISSSPIDTTTSNLAQPGRVVLLSSKRFEKSYYSWELKNGIFTYYLVQGFGGPADANQDGWVSAEEAFYYAKPKTTYHSFQKQHPQIYDGFEGELKITQTF